MSDDLQQDISKAKRLDAEIKADSAALRSRRVADLEAAERMAASIADAESNVDPALRLIEDLQRNIATEAADHAITKKVATLLFVRLTIVVNHMTTLARHVGTLSADDDDRDPWGLGLRESFDVNDDE
jgi:hypothetical protein